MMRVVFLVAAWIFLFFAVLIAFLSIDYLLDRHKYFILAIFGSGVCLAIAAVAVGVAAQLETHAREEKEN